MFKEPVAHQVRETLSESQTKSYIASETYLGGLASVTDPLP